MSLLLNINSTFHIVCECHCRPDSSYNQNVPHSRYKASDLLIMRLSFFSREYCDIRLVSTLAYSVLERGQRLSRRVFPDAQATRCRLVTRFQYEHYMGLRNSHEGGYESEIIFRFTGNIYTLRHVYENIRNFNGAFMEGSNFLLSLWKANWKYVRRLE